RLIARRPTPGLLRLADALEDRLGLSSWRPQEGELPMSWEMLREMDAQGIVTGAHTAEHTVLTNQRLDDARREIAQCKAALEKGLKRPVKHFAYCNGYYRAGAAVVGFALPLILTRLLPQAEFGTYKQVWLVVTTAYFMLQLGLAQSLYYFLPRKDGRESAWLTQASIALVSLGAVCAAAIY